MKVVDSALFKILCVALFIGGLAGCGKQTSEEYIQEAKQYIQDNNPAAAIVALKNAVQAEPRSAQARFELGQLYLQQKQFESAEKELNRAMEYGYAPDKVLPMLTEAYQRTGAYAALSKIEHEQAGLTTVERIEIGYFKVVSLVRLNKLDEARELIEELVDLETSSAYRDLIEAYPLLLDNEFEKANEALVKIREKSPQNAEVLKLLAQLKLSLKQPEEAAEIYKDYVSFYPEDNQTTFVLAKLLVDTGKLKDADPYIDKLLKINQENPLLNQLKAASSAHKQDFSEALKRAETAILGGIEDPSLRLIAGYSAYQLQDFESANRHLSFIASVLPSNHPGLRMLAASQLQLGLTSEVGEVLDRLDQLSEDDAPLFSKASYELLRDGFEKEAKKLVEKSADISRTAEDLTRLGLLKLSLNNLDGIVNLEEAVSQSPELESAQITLAKAYIATRQYDKALALSKSWKQSSQQDPRPYLVAGDVYTKEQNFAAAKKEFQQAMALDKESPSAMLALANIAALEKNMSLANQMLTEALQKFPNNIYVLASHYLLAKEQGNSQAGLNKIQQAFNQEPTNLGLRVLLARIKMVENDYQAAIDLLTAIENQKDLPVGYWKTLGQSLIKANKRREATVHYDAWLAREPNNKEALTGKLLLLDSQNKFAEAAKLTQGFLKNRDDLQVQILNVYFLLMQNKYQEAQVEYDKLPEQVLDKPIVKGFLARFQLNNGELQQALENAKIAYADSQNNRNLILLTFIYDKLKQSDKAIELLTQHLKQQPNALTAKMLLAERQISANSIDAIKTYIAALEQNPNNYIASNNLAYLYLQQGNVLQAKEFGEKAVELQPNNPATLDTLAQIYIAEGELQKALSLYERAVTPSMKNEEIYLNYVDLLFKVGDKTLAQRKLTQREMLEDKSISRVEKLKAEYQIQ
ncbi:XrtA/PEP-CTERM system TPR-repeat protein PrsT [Paraglaciecola aestuariivivens]